MSEEQNSGKRTLLIVLAAIVIVVAGIAAVAYFGKKPPVIVGQIVKLDAVPMHTETTLGKNAQGAVGGVEKYDQVIILAEVQLQNQSKLPFYLHEIDSRLAGSDGMELRDLAVNQTDFKNVFLAYPQLASLRQVPLLRDATIAPGQSALGMVIFHYDITKEQWDARQGFKVVFSFVHENDLEVPWGAAK